MPNALRKKFADEIVRDYSAAKSLLLLDYRKLKSHQAVEFRSQMGEAGMKVGVLKNSAAFHAFDQLGLKGLQSYLAGMTMVVTGDDPAVMAKKVYAFRGKNQDIPEVKGGYVEGRVFSSAEVKRLSELPSKDALRAQAVRTIAAPLQNLAMDLNGILQKLLLALNAVAAKETRA